MIPGLIDMDRPLWWTVDGVLSPEECRALIERIEAAGPELASINALGGPLIDERVRNNTRVIFDDEALAALLFARVRATVPERMMGMRLVGANERLRCYRYAPGQRFAAHYDGSFARDERERSLLTFMVYLNEGFAGGATALLDLEVEVAPRTGRALLFQHALLHEGAEVTQGVKYAVRSDLMFRAEE